MEQDKQIEKDVDISQYILSKDKLTINGVKDIYQQYKTLYIPKGVKIIEEEAFYDVDVENVLLPDSVEIIKKRAFKKCKQLKRIFIPKSVQVIGDEVFFRCNENLEIFCEGEPQDGWLHGEKTEKTYYDDMTDAFNFHRSGGSFDDHYVEKRVQITYNNYNPDNRIVHTNVSRAEFLKILD